MFIKNYFDILDRIEVLDFEVIDNRIKVFSNYKNDYIDFDIEFKNDKLILTSDYIDFVIYDKKLGERVMNKINYNRKKIKKELEKKLIDYKLLYRKYGLYIGSNKDDLVEILIIRGHTCPYWYDCLECDNCINKDFISKNSTIIYKDFEFKLSELKNDVIKKLADDLLDIGYIDFIDLGDENE